MKLIKVTLFPLVTLLACVSNKQPVTTSEWVDLNAVGSAACDAWPMTEKDLEVQTLLPLIGKDAHGFVASVKQRNSSVQHVYMPANSSLALNTDGAQLLPLAQGSVVVAAWKYGAVPLVVVANNNGSRSTLEARRVDDNRVITRSSFVFDGNIRGADFVVDGDTMWLTLKTGDASSVYARLKVKGTAGQFEKISATTESRGAVLIVDYATHLPYVVEAQPTAEKLAFKLTPIRTKELTTGASQTIQTDVQGGVESWAMTSAKGGFLFAAVTGDSMVGQGALQAGLVRIKGASMSWGWKQSLSFPDVHVSEPVWAASSEPVLTLMKWLDGEATMSVMRVAAEGWDVQKDRGVHHKGSIVTDGFVPRNNLLATIVRHKDTDLWIYSICKSGI